MHFNNNLDLEPKIINCKKDKISNGIDINSELILNLYNINVEIKTSLNKKLQNNLEITTNNEKIVFEKYRYGCSKSSRRRNRN